jgi:hypothetical protein
MNYSIKRVNALIRSGLIVAVLAIFSLVFSISTTATLIEQKKITYKVVEYKQVILATDSQRMNLFIDELLTPKSAKCFRKILMVESHMNPRAKNPTSSARGVGQLLASTYVNLGMKHSEDSLAQVVASLAYIGRFYGSAGPCGALAHERKMNWY